MNEQKRDLIVPIRDRRQHKRYLTVKNVSYVAVAALIVFAAISIRSELRGNDPGDYGRILQRELPTIEQKPVEIVQEASPQLEDARSADPMLVGAMAREQWLTGMNGEPIAVDELATSDAMSWRGSGRQQGGLAIVGGPDGVEVVQQNRRRPVLSGGFGR